MPFADFADANKCVGFSAFTGYCTGRPTDHVRVLSAQAVIRSRQAHEESSTYGRRGPCAMVLSFDIGCRPGGSRRALLRRSVLLLPDANTFLPGRLLSQTAALHCLPAPMWVLR